MQLEEHAQLTMRYVLPTSQWICLGLGLLLDEGTAKTCSFQGSANERKPRTNQVSRLRHSLTLLSCRLAYSFAQVVVSPDVGGTKRASAPIPEGAYVSCESAETKRRTEAIVVLHTHTAQT